MLEEQQFGGQHKNNVYDSHISKRGSPIGQIIKGREDHYMTIISTQA